ncbi:MAG TPA: Ku protein [Bacteroidia bacterium]|jgi:DNA end-binding protein Ku|nr:Ku protein [Bacteroidia bacterium]
MKPLWSGAIGFGLVNIPVSLFSATHASELDLDMLDKSDLSNIKFHRVNEKTGKEVKWENIVKGYKYKDRYVVLSPQDFEMANSKKSKMIELSNFVDEDEVNSIYYETPYYLAPEKNGMRAYALLREALLKTHKVGIASFVMRNKESLAILKPTENVIVLNRIRFKEEIRETAELTLPGKKEVKPAELQMAVSLINQLSSKFDISAHKDTYTAELLKLIKAKSKGQKIKGPEMKVVHSKAKDLMAQLKESLNTKHKKAS